MIINNFTVFEYWTIKRHLDFHTHTHTKWFTLSSSSRGSLTLSCDIRFGDLERLKSIFKFTILEKDAVSSILCWWGLSCVSWPLTRQTDVPTVNTVYSAEWIADVNGSKQIPVFYRGRSIQHWILKSQTERKRNHRIKNPGKHRLETPTVRSLL